MMKAKKTRLNLAITLVLFVLAILLLTFFVVGIIFFSLRYFGVITLPLQDNHNPDGNPIFAFFALLLLLCTIIGTALTAFLSKKALNPIRIIIDATKNIASGNFDVHLDIKGIGELEELSENFNKMAHELSTIETLRADFVNSFSHEFKTPIVSIRGFAKLLKENNLREEEKQEYLDIIIVESERLSELSTNVLNLSKYESIQIITDKQPFRLDEQVRRAIALFEQKWLSKNIEINVHLDEIIFIGKADLTQQIWINLLDNAIRFTDENGHINIRLCEWNAQIRFVIEDDGIGIEKQAIEYIFDRFFQGDSSHKTKGNGLGLALVKRIVNLCDGNIEVQSELDKGSKFIVSLPKSN